MRCVLPNNSKCSRGHRRPFWKRKIYLAPFDCRSGYTNHRCYRVPGLGSEADLRPDQICLVFQTPSLLPSLTVLENVELCWLLSKRNEADARSAALQILAKLDLSSIVDKLPDELSGGQVQRVAAARAVVCEPRLDGWLFSRWSKCLLEFLTRHPRR